MKRISKECKAIADRYILARQTNQFTPLTATTRDEVIQGILSGDVYEEVLKQVETRFCTITSILLSSQFTYTSQGYRQGVYKGFKALLGEVN